MTLPAASHVVPVLLALCVGGALAYYDPADFDSISTDVGGEEESPYLLHRVSDDDVRQAGGSWEAAPDPRLYVLTEGAPAAANDYEDNEQLQTSPRRVRRNTGPSLSIVNSLDVLRQRLLLEIARRRMRQSEDQILANREILKSIGKRDVGAAQHRGRQGAAGADGGATPGHHQDVRTKSGSSYSVKRGNHQQQL